MKRIISGIQATSDLHIGNYIGSIKNWVKLQNQYESFLFVADLHSITMVRDPVKLKNDIRNIVASYIASGLDSENIAIFVQSHIPALSELTWLFNCITPMGLMNRMTQFKEKAGKDKESASVGLYDYPILMAADILLYHADIVPVGDDQKQHLEITRDIAAIFNREFQMEYFKLPEAFISKKSSRIMSLRDGTKKMSKSDLSDFSKINLLDNPDQIMNKIRKAKTDSFEYVYYDKENRREISNLIEIYIALREINLEDFEKEIGEISISNFKEKLINLLIEKIIPIGEKIKNILSEPDYIDEILNRGWMKVAPIAENTIKQVKEIFGFPKRKI